MDDRIIKYAKVLVNYSVDVQKGDNVWISLQDCPRNLGIAIVKEVVARGGYPYVEYLDSRTNKEIIKAMPKDYYKRKLSWDLPKMKEVDAYIRIRGNYNLFELVDVPTDKVKTQSLNYGEPINKVRLKKKWVIGNFPSPSYAQQAGMSTEEFENYFYNVCTLDYAYMSKQMDALVKLMNKTDKVRIVGKGTDITFSIKGIGAVKCSGERNIPDGEVYTAPVKNSVNGVITFNVPTIENNIRFDNISLTLKDGKIIKATCDKNQDKLNAILDTDEGARYIGEFSFGINPYITIPMLDILFDEKMCGSIHFTPGSSYEDADNTNRSAIHWDMVLSQLPQYGGGEIYFDGKLIRKNGEFVIDSLKGLNPENLKRGKNNG